MIVYKIVRRIKGKRYSCIMVTALRMEYGEDRATLPLGETFLMAFKSYKSAKGFYDHLERYGKYYEIWEAEAETTRKQQKIGFSRVLNSTRILERIWKYLDTRNEKSASSNSNNLPKGTIFCKSITLIKKII